MLMVYPVRVTAVYIKLLRFAEMRLHLRNTIISTSTNCKMSGKSLSPTTLFLGIGTQWYKAHIHSDTNTVLLVQVKVKQSH